MLSLLAAALIGVQPGSQSECPPPADFLDVVPQTVAVRVSVVDDPWPEVRGALADWYRDTLAPRVARQPPAAQTSITLLEVNPSIFPASGKSRRIASRTCFITGRTGGVEHRIAFLFIAQPAQRRERSTVMVEVRWVGQNRGRAERTWRDEFAQSAALAESFIARLRRAP